MNEGDLIAELSKITAELGGTFAGDKFISIINRTRSNTTKK